LIPDRWVWFICDPLQSDIWVWLRSKNETQSKYLGTILVKDFKAEKRRRNFEFAFCAMVQGCCLQVLQTKHLKREGVALGL
jgi:hypothetical protein